MVMLVTIMKMTKMIMTMLMMTLMIVIMLIAMKMTMTMTAAMTITCILRWVPSVGQSAIINAKRPNCSSALQYHQLLPNQKNHQHFLQQKYHHQIHQNQQQIHQLPQQKNHQNLPPKVPPTNSQKVLPQLPKQKKWIFNKTF